MDKETSSRVSTIAADVLQYDKLDPSDPNSEIYNQLLDQAKTLAGSCMSQDETRGQADETPRHRVVREHAHLSGKIDALTTFLQHADAESRTGSEQYSLLEIQLGIMQAYRKLLAIRLQKWTAPAHNEPKKSPVASEPVLGEPVEIGGADEDRDGPIPFGA